MALLALLAATSTAAAAPQSPQTDPFYAPPPGLAAQPPGTILRSREVSLSAGPIALTGAAGKGYQLAYRTNDEDDEPVVGVTTLLVPSSPAPPGGRNLVSLQDAENSLDINCAPSYQLQKGAYDNQNVQLEIAILGASQLLQGHVMMLPDHLGPRSEYAVRAMEGHAVLDAARAALRFDRLGLRGVKTPIALVGYSGGAHATASANELHHSYAPELNLAAVAAGGVPVVDMATIDYLDGSLGAGVMIPSSMALDRAYPEFGLQSLLNARGKALAEEAAKEADGEEGCGSAVLSQPFARIDDFTVAPGIHKLPRVAAIIERNRLGQATPTAPSLYYHGVGDELLPVTSVDRLVAQHCADGATMRYVRDRLGIEHIQALANFVPLALSYISDRFAGRPAPNDCGPRAPSPTTRCASRRTLVLHPRVPKGLTVRRIEIRVAGRRVRTVRGPARALRVDLRGRSGRVRVELRMTGRRAGRTVTVRDRRTYRLCAARRR